MKIPVFYDPRMAAANSSRSPSSAKPSQVINDWLALSLPFEVAKMQPVGIEELAMAHSRKYVEGVLAGRIENGFRDRCPKIAESLKWTNGSFVSAATHVYRHGGFACSPTSGFHHAGYAQGGAFCTFNGLMVAAMSLMEASDSLRIGILDMDYHYGDGTAEIIDRLQVAERVRQVSGWGDWNRCEPQQLLEEVPAMIDRLECDILFYQAGADMHIDDPLGGLLTTEELRQRDQIVFEHCKKNDLPCVWNFAGGYRIGRKHSKGIGNSSKYTACQLRSVQALRPKLSLKHATNHHALDRGEFQSQGGFARLNKIFDAKVQELLQ